MIYLNNDEEEIVTDSEVEVEAVETVEVEAEPIVEEEVVEETAEVEEDELTKVKRELDQYKTKEVMDRAKGIMNALDLDNFIDLPLNYETKNIVLDFLSAYTTGKEKVEDEWSGGTVDEEVEELEVVEKTLDELL